MFTAEVLAERFRLPLLIVTAGDLGFEESRPFSKALFPLVERWDAVLVM